MLHLLIALAQSLTPAYGDTETEQAREARMAVVGQAVWSASGRAVCAEGWRHLGCVPIWPQEQRLELAVLTLAQGWHESKYLRRVHADRCRKDECDAVRIRGRVRHLARSPWQVQASPVVPRRLWRHIGGTNQVSTTYAAWAAVRVLATARARCKGAGVSWPEAAIASYATGRRCHWSRSANRARVYRRLLQRVRDTL